MAAPSPMVVLGQLCGWPRGVERASEPCSRPGSPILPDRHTAACLWAVSQAVEVHSPLLGPRWGARVGWVRSLLLGARGKDALRTLSSWGRSLTVACLLPRDHSVCARELCLPAGLGGRLLPGECSRAVTDKAGLVPPSQRVSGPCYCPEGSRTSGLFLLGTRVQP